MTDTDILSRLAGIVQEVTGIEANRVTPDKTFADDLDVDSLSMVEIATAAEDAFGVAIPDDAIGELKTVADAVAYISKAGVAA
jgi:acyl carrier protein